MTGRHLLESLVMLGTILWRTITDPESFLLAAPPPAASVATNTAEHWDCYWRRERTPVHRVYDALAQVYRVAIIRGALAHYIGRYFPTAGVHLLHAGCGGGQVDGVLPRRYRLTALDFSPVALERYRRENPQAFSCVQGDLLNLNLPAQSFDGIYNLGVMEHFTEDEIQTVLSGFYRALRPGGAVVLFWPPHYGLATRFLSLAQSMLDRGSSGVQLFPSEVTRLASPEHARRIVERAGFVLKACHFGPRDAWTHVVVVAIRPVTAPSSILLPTQMVST